MHKIHQDTVSGKTFNPFEHIQRSSLMFAGPSPSGRNGRGNASELNKVLWVEVFLLYIYIYVCIVYTTICIFPCNSI